MEKEKHRRGIQTLARYRIPLRGVQSSRPNPVSPVPGGTIVAVAVGGTRVGVAVGAMISTGGGNGVAVGATGVSVGGTNVGVAVYVGASVRVGTEVGTSVAGDDKTFSRASTTTSVTIVSMWKKLTTPETTTHNPRTKITIDKNTTGMEIFFFIFFSFAKVGKRQSLFYLLSALANSLLLCGSRELERGHCFLKSASAFFE